MKGKISVGIERRLGPGSSFRGVGGIGVYAKPLANPVGRYEKTLLNASRNPEPFIGEPGNAYK